MVMSDQELDLRGLKCPLPALLSRRALARAEPGAIIEVLVDDPLAPVDVPHMCHVEGFHVLDTIKGATFTRLRLGKPLQPTDGS